MGQQQLLLIILGVIIVGIAVAVGINMFTASAAAANRDAVSADLQNLAAMAQQYYRRPTSLGGGNNSFAGWAIPSQLASNANGTYALSGTPDADSAVILGTGTEVGDDATNPLQMRALVTRTAITITKVN